MVRMVRSLLMVNARMAIRMLSQMCITLLLLLPVQLV
jgi:hypothetical protein